MSRCLVVEDDELFRLGLEITLASFALIDTVVTANDGELAIELLRHQAIEVILLDLGLPGLGGLETCRRITEEHPEIPILVITSQEDPRWCRKLLQAGARGYVRKGISALDLELAIQTVLRGASWWDAEATTAMRALSDPADIPRMPQAAEDPLLALLTPRERQVLEAMGRGMSNQQIADALGISLGTVRVHGHAIMQKLDVSNRTQAVLKLKV